MFWLRNKKISFLLCTLLSPAVSCQYQCVLKILVGLCRPLATMSVSLQLPAGLEEIDQIPIGLDKENFSAYNCKYFLTYNV